MVSRLLEEDYRLSQTEFPVTGIIGPRQVGKTTMVKGLISTNHIYLDLERPSDLNKLIEPELFLNANREKTVILDEVQHQPNIFPILRSLVDDHRRPGRFVILGSASPTLLRQSSESLAGRINYLEMFPMLVQEMRYSKSHEELWLHGGFPEPLLSGKPSFIQKWYRNFVQTYIERDLPLYGLPARPQITRRFLMMITSTHGQILNHSTYARSLGLSIPTIKTYLYFLNNAFLVYLLPPWYQNMKKRIIKSPKIFIRDSGMLHYLAGIGTYNALIGHAVVGSSWEGFVIIQIRAILRSDDEMFFYRTQDGAEIDLLVRRNDGWLYAFEIKFSNAPILTRGTFIAIKDLGIKKLHVITPGSDTYLMTENVEVTSLTNFLSTRLEQ